MRIALCFSGQPRSVKESYYFSILKNLIEPNNITDIFVHTWWRPEWETKAYTDSYPQPSVIFKKDSIETIKNLYKPLKMVVEDDNIYKETIKNDFVNDISWAVPGQSISEKKCIYVTYPRYMSPYKSNQLKNEYEKENGFEYDMVIKTRFDIIPRVRIDIKNYNVSKYFYIPTCYPQTILEVLPSTSNKWCGAGDIIAVGNKQNMDIYCDIFNRIKETSLKHPSAAAEGTLGYYLADNNVPLYFAWIDRQQICVYRQLQEWKLVF